MRILAWPIKRLAVARLVSYSDGSVPPPAGAELLVSTDTRPVQVARAEPAEMERIAIYPAPVRSVFREITAESPDIVTETAAVDFRVRVYAPGEYDHEVEQTLDDMTAAVATALTASPLASQTRLWLAGMTEEPPVRAGAPDPGVTMAALLSFRAEAVAYGGG